MKSLLILVLLNILDPGTSTCFEEQPLDPKLQEHLALKKSCADTLFPEPPCCGNSVENENSRIINGEQTGLREQTWTVFIKTTNKNLTSGSIHVFACGGSLINPLWVLSAAHCFKVPNFELLQVEIHLGEWNIKTDPDCINKECADKVIVTKIPLEHIEIHPEYSSEIDWTNDLALLRLERPVKYSDFITPVCLPLYPLKKQCFENQRAIAVGWGRIVPGYFIMKSSNIKLKTTLTIWETDKCEKFKTQIKLKDEYQICASAGRNSTCHGDSGGPFSLKLKNTDSYYQLGVVSGGIPTCDGTIHPAILARINLKWIIDVILGAKYN